MRGPHLQRTSIVLFTILSLAFHATIFVTAILVLKHTNQAIMPSPYTVSLVNPEPSTGINEGRQDDAAEDAPAPSPPSVAPRKSRAESAKDKDLVERKLDALKAKKKIEKIVRLRSVIDLKARGDKSAGSARVPSSARAKGGGAADYYSMITKEIWQQWVYPDTGQKDIEAVISIKILKDGTAIVQKVEKSSGNALFDRSAVRAIAKASPLPPPPEEMEIGVRFYP
jgi:colicin import membrane protein